MQKGFNLFSIVRDSRKYPQLFWGALIMFFYVGAEACTAGFYINYLKEVAGFTPDVTAQYLTYYYIAATVMSFVGILLLQVISPGRLVAIFGSGMVLMYLLASLTTSSLNPYYLVGMGVFISIIFPSLFSLGIEGIGSFTEKGSALINIAIVGGAVFPPIQGAIADTHGVQVSYLVPCACFLLIIAYGVYCDRRHAKVRIAQKSGE
jgi:FHS family L-fucose permease-like MFS transporter